MLGKLFPQKASPAEYARAREHANTEDLMREYKKKSAALDEAIERAIKAHILENSR